jgi:hypothetical protein
LTLCAAQFYADAVAGVRIERTGATRWLRIERPPRNLLDPVTMGALADELRQCDTDEAVPSSKDPSRIAGRARPVRS